VTPSNIMVSTRGEVKLIDFGVAKAATQLTFTPPGYVKGKFRFMSPEQINQKPLDGRSDIFSLGVALYEISTGLQPFGRAEIVDILKAIVSHQPLPPAGIVPGFPAELQAVIGKAIRKDRERRFADAEAMVAALNDALGKMPGCVDIGRYIRDLAAESKSILKPPPTGEPDEVEPTVAMTQSEVARLREADERAEAAERALESTQSETDRPAPALRTDTTDPDAPQPTSIVGAPPSLPWEDEDAAKSPPLLPLQPPLRGPLVPPPLPSARPAGAGVFQVPPPLRRDSRGAEPAWAGAGPSPGVVPASALGRRRRRSARGSSWPTIIGLVLLVLGAAAITWLALRQALLQRSQLPPPPAPTSTSSPGR
jgi:serine/threonine protein kinase